MTPTLAARPRTAFATRARMRAHGLFALDRTVGVEAVDRERQDRAISRELRFGRRHQVGFGDLADEQAGDRRRSTATRAARPNST